MTAVYIVSAWVLLQVADLAFAAAGIDEVALRHVWLAVIIGFPLALVFSWRYDITAQGIRLTKPRHVAAASDLSLRRVDYLLLAALVAIALMTVSGISMRVAEDQAAIDVAPKTRAIEPHSIAILPLANLSPDPEQAFFAIGMHDSLINSISKVTALQVTSRTSASRVDKKLTMPMIGRTLGVANLIEGSIYRDGNRVRVVVQLINAASDKPIWAESYEREFSDVLSLQADIARAVARAVEVRLTHQDEESLARTLLIQPNTFESYLRAMFQFRKETRRGYRRGIEILEEALENDPTGALAYAGLAQGYAELGHSPFPVRGAYVRAKAAADKAIDLDDTLAEAHLAVGMYKLYYEYDWEGAEAGFRRALELNPSLTDAWYHMAWQLELFGRDEEAIAAGEKTVQLSPLSPFYISWLGDQYRDAGQYERAIDMAESVLELNPDYPVAWMVLGSALGELGKHEEAIEAHSNLGDSAFWSWARSYTFGLAGRKSQIREIIANIEPEPDNGLPLALSYASLGDVDQAMFWLDQVAEARIPWYPWMLGWFPQFRGLQGQPLVIAKAEELGVPLLPGPN
jgi:TolB-like protein/Tfp pilus assembly protein PilF